MNQATKDFIGVVTNLRPIKAFDPLILITTDIRLPAPDALDQSVKGSYWWSPEAKQVWFLTYCQENSLLAQIITEFIGSDMLTPVPDSSVEGQVAHLVREHWRASIIVNGEKVSEADSTGFVKTNSFEDRKYSSNQIRKYAIGAALSQYGFGAISTFSMNEEDIREELKRATDNPPPAAPQFVQNNAQPVPAGQMNVQPNGNPPAHNPMNFGVSGAGQPANPVGATAHQVMQDSFFGSNNGFVSAPVVTASATSAPPACQPSVPPVQAAPVQQDPLVEAKAMQWPGKGKFAGKTLGDILSAPGAQKNLEWTVNEWSPRSNEGKAFQAAAKLLLDNLVTGK